MWIYKIINDVNEKVYIGQSIRPVEKRFSRHIYDAVSNKIDTHFARAIRKYGKEHFHISIIDTATTQKELTKKEKFWINFYNSTKTGYNETDATYKSGGNTYINKTKEELIEIGQKIRNTKIGVKIQRQEK